jgi:hypothetical protein
VRKIQQVSKNPQHWTKPIQAKYPRAQREIIISFEGPTKEELNQKSVDLALRLVNKTIVDIKDIVRVTGHQDPAIKNDLTTTD